MAEESDGFDKLRATEFARHSGEQGFGDCMIMHEGPGKLDEQPLTTGKVSDGRLCAKRFNDFRINAELLSANFVAAPG